MSLQPAKTQLLDTLAQLIEERLCTAEPEIELTDHSKSDQGRLSIILGLREHLEENIKANKDGILKKVGIRGINRIMAERLLDEPSGVNEQNLIDLYHKHQKDKKKPVSDEKAKAQIQEVFARVNDIITKHLKIHNID